MSWSHRVELMRRIETCRESKLVCYVTSDRQDASGQMASDAIPWLYQHIKGISHCPQLDLFLYTTGGATMAAWRVVALLREACDRFAVLVPHKAHSAGTLIALGASEIVMLRSGELSPVDPSTHSPFNPVPQIGMAPQPIMVEDVKAYIDLARKEAQLQGEEVGARVFELLARKVHPLALGHVYRARQQIRMLARRLLELHMQPHDQRIDEIVRKVTEEFLSHDYPVSRREAQAMELPVRGAEHVTAEFEDDLWALYESYRQDLRLLEPWTPQSALGQETEADAELTLAMVESTSASDVFAQRKRIKRVAIPQLPAPGLPPVVVESYQQEIVSQGWERKEAC